MKAFKSHIILELCHQHLEGISHVCMQCVQALCIKCIVLDHEDHEHQVEEYNEGMEKLKSEFEKVNYKLKEKTTKVDRYQQETEIQIKTVEKDEESMKKKRDALMEPIGKIHSELPKVRYTERIYNKELENCKNLKEKCELTCINVDKPMSPFVLSSFQKKKITVEKLITEIDKLKIIFKATDVGDRMKKSNSYEEFQWLSEAKLEKTFDKLAVGDFNIIHPTSIKVIEPDLLIYSDMDTNTFVLFNKDGVVQRSIQEHQNVRCIDVYENSLYLALEEQIIRIDDFNTWAETEFTFTPKIKIYNMAVVNNNIIVCTEFHEGRVYEYNSEDDTTKMVQDLSNMGC